MVPFDKGCRNLLFISQHCSPFCTEVERSCCPLRKVLGWVVIHLLLETTESCGFSTTSWAPPAASLISQIHIFINIELILQLLFIPPFDNFSSNRAECKPASSWSARWSSQLSVLRLKVSISLPNGWRCRAYGQFVMKHWLSSSSTDANNDPHFRTPWNRSKTLLHQLFMKKRKKKKKPNTLTKIRREIHCSWLNHKGWAVLLSALC